MTITLYWGVRNYNDRRPLQDLSEATETQVIPNVNFAASDGLETVLTVNTDLAGDSSLIFPSYLTCSDGTEWYILSCVKTRGRQLTLSLHRNLLAERWNELQNLPFVFRKASDIEGPAFNYSRYMKTTNMSQVKTAEYKISDITDGNGWLVGYVNKELSWTDTDGETVVHNGTVSVNPNRYSYDFLVDSLENWEHYNETVVSDRQVSVAWRAAMSRVNTRLGQINVTRSLTTPMTYDFILASNQEACTYAVPGTDSEAYKNAWLGARLTMVNDIGKALSSVVTAHSHALGESYETGDLSQYDGKIVAVKDQEGAITRYRCHVTESSATDSMFSDADAETVYNALQSKAYNINGVIIRPFSSLKSTDVDYGMLRGSCKLQKLTLTLLRDQAISVDYRNAHAHSADTLYDIFAIPLGGNFSYVDEQGSTHALSISKNKEAVAQKLLLLMTELYATWGDQLIDLQWLPYGPVGENYTFIQAQSTDYRYYCYSPIMEGDNVLSLMYWCQESQYQRQLPVNLSAQPYGIAQSYSGASNAVCRRWEEEHLVRLVSPNFASQFEFSPIKNDGLEAFNIYIAYKPYSPYIRVAPKFGGLYGSDYNDGRGLILSGDFSLDRTSSAWTQYKLQNKNYQLIFDRQIQSMDLRNEYQDRLDNQASVQDIFSVLGGTAQGLTQGAMSGALIGGGIGALAGAAVGGISSLGTGIADAVTNSGNRKMAKLIRDDTRQAAIDQFHYQLGNIKAMPDTITKIATFNPDYKVYPILEIYTCTEQEEINFRLATEWNGYDVNVYAPLSAADSGYIAGTILRFDGLSLNAAETRDINYELNEGVYI